MMKHIMLMIFLVFAGTVGEAQTPEEWLRQKETGKKYLIQQIAAFMAYLSYVQKGYSIAQKGLTTIDNIKKGDFNLHSDFFAHLKNVNPKISRYAKVAHIIAIKARIAQVYKDTYKQAQASGLYNAEEVDYIFTVFANLLNNCSTVIAELTKVITPDELEMKDGERLKRIDAFYSTMQEHYTFAQGFGRETKLLTIQRMKEKKDVQQSRILNGIKRD
jgi:hypothetical protein